MRGRAQSINQQRVESDINKISGVYANKVVFNNGSSDIDEIHVLANPTRNPKQIVRDIESLLYVKFGTRVDYRRVSLVQLEGKRVFSYLYQRPKLAGVIWQQDPPAVQVRLARGDGQDIVGRLGTDGAGEDEARAVALATLDAIQQIITDGDSLHLERMLSLDLGQHEAIGVLLSYLRPVGEEYLLGTSFVRGDWAEAAARATLDAVNRRFFRPPVPVND